MTTDQLSLVSWFYSIREERELAWVYALIDPKKSASPGSFVSRGFMPSTISTAFLENWKKLVKSNKFNVMSDFFDAVPPPFEVSQQRACESKHDAAENASSPHQGANAATIHVEAFAESADADARDRRDNEAEEAHTRLHVVDTAAEVLRTSARSWTDNAILAAGILRERDGIKEFRASEIEEVLEKFPNVRPSKNAPTALKNLTKAKKRPRLELADNSESKFRLTQSGIDRFDALLPSFDEDF